MRISILTSLALLTSLMCGCSSAPTKSLLEERAGYGSKFPPFGLDGAKNEGVHYVPTRMPEKVAVAWLYPHELPPTEYFWGSWLSIVVAQESWEMVKVEATFEEKAKVKDNRKPQSNSRPKSAKPKVKAASGS